MEEFTLSIITHVLPNGKILALKCKYWYKDDIPDSAPK